MRQLTKACASILVLSMLSCSGGGTYCPESPEGESTVGLTGAPSASAAPQAEGRASPVAPVPDSSNVDIRTRTYDVLVEGGFAIKGGSVGVTMVSIDELSAPHELGRVVLPGSVNGLAMMSPGLLAAGCASEGVFLLDISSPTAPRTMGHLQTNGAVWRLRRQGDDLLAADGHAGVAILRIHEGAGRTSLREVGRWPSIGYVRAVEPWGENRALVAEGREGLAALDLSNPSAPRLLSRLDTEGEVRAVDVRDEVAFVADFHQGVLAVDVAEPGRMNILGRVETSDSARDVMAIGDFIAIAIGTDGVLLVDASSPASMTTVGRYETALPAVRFAHAGAHLAVAVDSGGVEILDVSDPTTPRQVSAIR